jgi:predicted ferric reductase
VVVKVVGVGSSVDGMLNKSQRVLLGLFVLLLVDVIWVSSSELTKVSRTYVLFTSTVSFSLLEILHLTFLLSPRHRCVSNWGHLFDKGGISLSI